MVNVSDHRYCVSPSAVRTVGGVRVGLGRFERTGHADSTGNFLNRPNLDSPSKEIEI
jgi:hypothetical protein